MKGVTQGPHPLASGPAQQHQRETEGRRRKGWECIPVLPGFTASQHQLAAALSVCPCLCPPFSCIFQPKRSHSFLTLLLMSRCFTILCCFSYTCLSFSSQTILS